MNRQRKKIEDLEAPVGLKILVTIVNRKKANFFTNVLQGYDVNMQIGTYARGTAPSDMRSLLGLDSSEKAVILGIVREDKVKEILTAYEEKYFRIKDGKGIAFTISINSMIGVMLYKFLANQIEGENS